MAQFWVYKNGSEKQAEFPYLLDIQNNLLEALDTRVVVPLVPVGKMGYGGIQSLEPVFKIGSKSFSMSTPDMASVPRQLLGPKVTDLSAERSAIVGAFDFLISGF